MFAIGMHYLFRICVLFLEWVGNISNLTYQQISVYINLYLQSGILIFSSIPVLVMAIVQKNPFWIAISALNTGLYLLGFVWIMLHYRLPGNITFAFDQCVKDLQYIAQKWHMSYQQVNIVIFVMVFLLLLFFNIGLYFLISK